MCCMSVCLSEYNVEVLRFMAKHLKGSILVVTTQDIHNVLN